MSMKELNIPFSLFDFFATLMPGAVGLFGVYLMLNPGLTQTGHAAVFGGLATAQFESELVLAAGMLLLSYLLGHVLNALAELLIDKPANSRLGAHIVRDIGHPTVQAALKETFGADTLKQSRRRTFTMMEALVSRRMPEAAANANRFIALAVMFESLALALLLVGVALARGYAIGALAAGSFVQPALTLGLLLGLVGLMLWSYRRYKGMWSRTIAMGFAAWAMSGDGDGKPVRAAE